MITQFDKALFWWLFFSFISATVVGTLTHECGHYFAAKCLGHDANLHYASTSWSLFENAGDKNSGDSFWILISGPLQSLLTGTLGIVLLYLFRKTFYQADKLSVRQWVIIFLSIFWSRQVANITIWTGSLILNSNYSLNKDEIKIARHFQIAEGLILTMSALIGLFILIVIIFKFIPNSQRLSYVFAGLLGSTVGYICWIEFLGQFILP